MGSISGSGRFPAEGNGNPLQCSHLEDSMDGRAWWAAVHGVANSQTQLNRLSTHTQKYIMPLSGLVYKRTSHFYFFSFGGLSCRAGSPVLCWEEATQRSTGAADRGGVLCIQPRKASRRLQPQLLSNRSRWRPDQELSQLVPFCFELLNFEQLLCTNKMLSDGDNATEK